ncbi:MAG: hypothetical protein WC645_07240 [Candidatus Margulisiibacteriota bacterium]
MKLKNIVFLTFAFLILTLGAAQAVTFTATGNPDDTLSGTVITALATQETLDYSDVNGNAKTQVTPSTGNINITVLPVYGFSAGALADRNLYKGQTVTNYAGITNEGNASDNYTLTFAGNFTAAGAGTWTINIRRASDNSLLGVLTAGSTTTSEVRSVAEDGEFQYYHQITSPSGGDAGANIVITTTATTGSTPVGQYTGANGLTYGGVGTFTDTATYTIATPLLTLTRTATTDAPKANNPVGYSGGIHDIVPGAIITYTLTYSNTGNSSGESVVLVDKVPPNTNLAHINQTGNTTNVNITVAQGNSSGWAVYYSTQDSPQKDYGNSTGWTSLGTLTTSTTTFPSSNTYVSGNAPWNATWVKWEKQYVDQADDGKTLTWGVTVR